MANDVISVKIKTYLNLDLALTKDPDDFNNCLCLPDLIFHLRHPVWGAGGWMNMEAETGGIVTDALIIYHFCVAVVSS